jgi:hypothetical protein
MIWMFSVVKLICLGLAACCFVWGLYQLMSPLLQRLSRQYSAERRHQASMRALREPMRKDSRSRIYALKDRWASETELMLKTVQGERYQSGAVERFTLSFITAGATAGVIAYVLSADVRFSLFTGGLVTALILLRYRLKLRSIRIQNGYDLAEAVGILSAKYKMSRGNMRTALRLAAGEVSSPTIRRMFLHMVRQELTYTEPAELERVVGELVYGIPTSFAKQLGLTILKGLLQGENVEHTLLTIDKNIHKQIDLLRDESDSSSEVLQLSWLHVVLFPLLMGLMVVFMGWSSTVHYQLGTETGRFWLMTASFCIASSLLMAAWFRKPPNDY